MEEINLTDLFKYFLRKWYVILILFVVVLSVGIIYSTSFKVPMYNSKTTLVLAMSNTSSNNDIYNTNEDNSITQNDILLNQKLIGTYREIIKSRNILKQVISNLNLEESVTELSELITVNSVSDTEIIEISVLHQDAETSKKIANKIAYIFSEEIVDIYNIKNVKIIDYAEVAKTPANINLLKEIVIYTLIGLVLGFAIVFIMYYFDTTIKSVEEVEKKLELPILGSIPKSTHVRKKA